MNNNTVRQLIKELEAEKKAIDNRIRAAYTLLAIERPKPESPGKPAKTFRGAGFITTVLPYLQDGTHATAGDMFKFLKKQPGMKDANQASFQATIYSELKKKNSRLVKVGDGLFALNPNAAAIKIAPVEDAETKARFDFPATADRVEDLHEA
jgi:hypothetical protein